MAYPAAVNAEQRISRTTSEGRTELDPAELLDSEPVRRAYEDFAKLQELMAPLDFEKIANTTREAMEQLQRSGQFEQLKDLRQTLERLLQVERRR